MFRLFMQNMPQGAVERGWLSPAYVHDLLSSSTVPGIASFFHLPPLIRSSDGTNVFAAPSLTVCTLRTEYAFKSCDVLLFGKHG